MERKWIVASFGDIRGFGTWEYRAATPPEEKELFISRFYETMQKYLLLKRDIHFKYGGDGFLVIKDFTLPERRNGALIDHLIGLRTVTRMALKDLGILEYSRLDGFRVRHFSGYAYKLKVLDPNDPDRKRICDEFVGYVVNSARRLLEVNPEITCLATEDLVRHMGKKAGEFKPKNLGKPSCYPRSVNKEDVDSLKILRF